MPSYTAITIGPIYKTMSQARKSRHLWGASYLFSFIMKQLLAYLLKDAELQLNRKDILLPYIDFSGLETKTGTGTGLYPDRLFLRDEGGLAAARVPVYEEKIINLIVSKLGSQYGAYLKNYIRIYPVSYSLPLPAGNAVGADGDYNNIIWVGNKLLDSLEQKEKYHPDITGIYWSDIIDDLNGRLLYRDAFDNVSADFQFPSVIEIATDDFRQRNPGKYQEIVREHLRNKEETENNQLEFLQALTKNASLFKGLTVQPYHKYMAVVQADGDSIGKTIAAIGSDEAGIHDFSKALVDFAHAASKRISSYGGKPVYVGGDDVFFFAPVAVEENNNVQEENNAPIRYLITLFDLVRDLDQVFREHIIEHPSLKQLYNRGVVKPSLSYGISVVYSKYPLNEARDMAYHLLQRAKAVEGDKNKVCFRVLRHSGQGFGFTIDKKKSSGIAAQPHSYDFFTNLCTRIPKDPGLLSAVIYSLAPMHAILNTIGADEQRMKDFFENMFNEPHHRIPAIRDFLLNTSSYIRQVYKDFPDNSENMPEYESEERNGNLAKVYSTLRFLKMLVDDE